MKYIYILLIPVFLISCGEKSPQDTTESLSPANQSQSANSPFPGLFGKIEGEAISVSEARKRKAGATITLTGKIIGNKFPFVEGRASFVMGDPEKITSCDLMGEEDHCPTPWDVCCDDVNHIRNSTLSVQVLDQAGKVLKTGLKNQGGLKELSMISIRGVISPLSSDQAMIINAEKIMIHPEVKKLSE
ncbi:MAG: hypothetical protein HQL32_00790 [Planctomycetes bacterium]|nr:hypothetical protein [Planctomycetota bacterium]